MNSKTSLVVSPGVSSFTVPILVMEEIMNENCVYSAVYYQGQSSIIVLINEERHTVMSCYIVSVGHEELYNVYGALLSSDATIQTSLTKQGKIVQKYEIVFDDTGEARASVCDVIETLSEQVLGKM